MRGLWRIVAATCVLGLWLPGAGHAAPEHAEIAFAGDGRIWSSRADGSDRRLLIAPTRARESLTQPVWSPDGSALAYVSEGDEASRLMVLDGTGSHALTPLRNGVSDHSPAWSPDGSTLAFARFTETRRGYRSDIIARAVATGAERVVVSARLDPRLSSVGEPSWSPDGTAIAYTHSRLDRRHDFRPVIRTVAAGGGTSRVLIRDAQSPAWSPDGRRLAFASVRDRNGRRCGSHECWYAAELYTAAADGSALVRLAVNQGLTDNAYRYLRRHGASVAFHSPEAGARVLSGHAVTTIHLARGNRLRHVSRVIRSLRPYEASRPARRLALPRVPRVLARRLESAARARRRHGTIERTARALGIARFEVEGRLRLRRALRSFGPYRFSACAGR